MVNQVAAPGGVMGSSRGTVKNMSQMFDAVVLAQGPNAHLRVSGLTLTDRGRRVAELAGARRVFVVTTPAQRQHIAAWWRDTAADSLLVVRAGDQLVHTPLLSQVLDGTGTRRLALGATGSFAGVLWAAGPAAGVLAAELADGEAVEIATRWIETGEAELIRVTGVTHYRVRGKADATAARRYLERIIHKSQDGAVTRYLYRPVSLLITRGLLLTSIRPNHVSLVVGLLGFIGVVFTAQYEYQSVMIGSALVLLAGYLDACDGEVARLRLQTSRFGAWLDTITDEITTVAYMAALGWHTYLHHPEPWIAGSIVASIVLYLVAIYVIYYYLITVAGSANSQDYMGKVEVVYDAKARRRTIRPVQAATHARSGAMRTIEAFVPQLIRRDLINWGALFMALAQMTSLSYALFVVGGAATAATVVPEHLHLRRLAASHRRSLNDGLLRSR